MQIQSLDDLFLHTLKDVLFAERTALKVLPKMERRASAAQLKATLLRHRDETEGQLSRLEDVLEGLGKTARVARCDAIVGLVDETDSLMAEIEDPETRDAALIAIDQAIKHDEIARYGTLVAWARQLGHADAADLLTVTLDEEYGADKALSKLAEERLNAAAA